MTAARPEGAKGKWPKPCDVCNGYGVHDSECPNRSRPEGAKGPRIVEYNSAAFGHGFQIEWCGIDVLGPYSYRHDAEAGLKAFNAALVEYAREQEEYWRAHYEATAANWSEAITELVDLRAQLQTLREEHERLTKRANDLYRDRDTHMNKWQADRVELMKATPGYDYKNRVDDPEWEKARALLLALAQEKAALEAALVDVANKYVPVDQTIDIPALVNRAALKVAEREARERALVEALNKASCIESKHFPDHWCCVSCGAWYDYATKECLGHTEGCYVAAALAPRPRHEEEK